MDKMTFAAFEDRYVTALKGRFLGLPKRMPKSIKYEDYMEARFRVAPIEWLGYPTRLRFDLRVDKPVRTIYWRRKKIKMICTEDALNYFTRIK